MGEPVRRNQARSDAAAQAERLWIDRLQSERLQGAIAAWKRAVAAADDDATSWLMLARAQYFLADAFLARDKGSEHEEVAQAFADGAAYADRGLRALSPTYEGRRLAGLKVDEAASGLGAEVVPFLYWWGLGLIRWADCKGWSAAAGVYQGVLRAMQTVAELDPSYDHGGAERFLGAFYTDAPSLFGGDLAAGKAHLDRALALAPSYFETWLVLGSRYAKKTHDEALYARARAFILETPSEAVPDAVPEQEITKRKVRLWTAGLFK